MLNIESGTTPRTVRTVGALVGLLLSIVTAGCAGSSSAGSRPGPVTLTIGFGLAAGANPALGIRQFARNLALEELVRIARDGRIQPKLAESWSVSSDGLTWRVRLRPSVVFHDGKPADADVIRKIVQARLPEEFGSGSGSEDVAGIRTVSDRELEFALSKRSTFLLEQLGELAIEEPGAALSGTGPFYVTSQDGDEIEMRANARYHGGGGAIDRIVIKPYTSVRSAWADMLRRQVDMLYDVGVDALDSLQASNDVKVFTFERGYAYLVLLNVRKPYLRDAAFRRQLNAAIDRQALVTDALRGHGIPAESAVWPHHWAYTAEDLPGFHYDPHPAAPGPRRRLTCIYNEPAYEPLAQVLRKQLREIGVEMELQRVDSSVQLLARLKSGDFDAFLSDFRQGPDMVRPYVYWHSGAPDNYGGFSSLEVDTALDAIRHAPDDATYKAGVGAFERAMVNDPPAIFLAWRERARAVSTRFRVVVEPGGDVFATLHAWRPDADAPGASRTVN